MTAHEVTGPELLHARDFLALVSNVPSGNGPPPDILPIRLKDLLLLLAWYGRIRADGAPPGRMKLVAEEEPKP